MWGGYYSWVLLQDVRIQNEEERLEREQRRVQLQADTEEIEAEVAMLREREDRIRQLEVMANPVLLYSNYCSDDTHSPPVQ